MSARSVREAVDARFGAGAGKRVNLICKDSPGAMNVMYEVRLSLPPVVQLRQDSPSLADALAKGQDVPPGCGQGRLP